MVMSCGGLKVSDEVMPVQRKTSKVVFKTERKVEREKSYYGTSTHWGTKRDSKNDREFNSLNVCRRWWHDIAIESAEVEGEEG
jgi:hypothetical protein